MMEKIKHILYVLFHTIVAGIFVLFMVVLNYCGPRPNIIGSAEHAKMIVTYINENDANGLYELLCENAKNDVNIKQEINDFLAFARDHFGGRIDTYEVTKDYSEESYHFREIPTWTIFPKIYDIVVDGELLPFTIDCIVNIQKDAEPDLVGVERYRILNEDLYCVAEVKLERH